MRTPITVSLNCAGSGRRLGLGQTKALIDILGRPLIHWQLDLLEQVEDVRIVVGYHADKVINAVLSHRRNAVFVFNHRHAETGTGDSLLLAAENAAERVLTLDGDLLVHPRNLRDFLSADKDMLGIVPVLTDDAICVTLDGSAPARAIGFGRGSGTPWEWSGLAVCSREILAASALRTAAPRHVYHLLEHALPLPVTTIDAREIDTPGDYDRALAWMRQVTNGSEWQ